ncbi:MAG: hypothetical protein H6Q89_885, partial [Myxococcaceae bacterium]|nr:hypothetical protein [Myxococcaceae bacterium]
PTTTRDINLDAMADVGTVRILVRGVSAKAAPFVAGLISGADTGANKIAIIARCTLQRISYQDRWMNMRPGQELTFVAELRGGAFEIVADPLGKQPRQWVAGCVNAYIADLPVEPTPDGKPLRISVIVRR